MAPATASPTNSADDADDHASDLRLRWSGRVSLTRRILAVNVLALLLLAGGFFYLDSYRSRLVDSRTQQAAREAGLIANAFAAAGPGRQDALLRNFANDTRSRLRIYAVDGTLLADTRAFGLRTFVLRDPDRQGWQQRVARFLDAGIDTIVGADRDPLFRDRRADGLAWPDVRRAIAAPLPAAMVWRAPDRTPVITAAARIDAGRVVLTAINARDITSTVRDERLRLAIVLGVVTLVSILLSLFLARTIVRPIRRLARAAVRVRLGRAREVVVPRLPSRRDELGMLARALSDMSLALRGRIDATEAFAADVTHELKNPLASLRSALDGIERVPQPELRTQLLAVAQDDVRRLDRLIGDISETSRLDAQLSRAKFEPVELNALIARLVAQRSRTPERAVRIAYDRIPGRATMVFGEEGRLERVFSNLLDNAMSFSPDGGVIAIAVLADGDDALVRIDDEGPGVPVDAREAIFERFHSVRPAGEEFGRHSGLGLAISRTIVTAHQGSIVATDRDDRTAGARFEVRLPLLSGGE